MREQSAFLGAWVYPETHQDAKDLAAQQQQTISELIRQLITKEAQRELGKDGQN